MIYLARICVIVLLAFSVLSFFSTPGHEDHSRNLGHAWEEYDSSYFTKFQTVQSIIRYADSSVGADKRNSLAYNNFVAATIRKRFYHGYSYYQFFDNPLAYLCGRFVWSNLSAIVIPDDIMKHPMAACSQQSIILTEVFRRNEINYRKVAFAHHFALEGFIEDKWHYFDTDMEPDLQSREPLDVLLAENKLIEAYRNTGFSVNYLHDILAQPKPGKTNESPAANATIFHQICKLLVSKWFLILLFILTFWKTIRAKILRKFLKGKKGTIREKSPLAMAS